MDELKATSILPHSLRQLQAVLPSHLLDESADNVALVPSLTIGIPLPLGVVGHEGSTILVVANGLRLLRALPAKHFAPT